MKTQIVIIAILTCLFTSNTHAQKQKVEGYKNKKTETIQSSENDNMKSLFKETFSSEGFDQEWVVKSATANLTAFQDDEKGKVLKIKSNRANGDSFLEKDLTQLLRGKDVKLQAEIKLIDVVTGNQSYEQGQLCIKYNVNGEDYYAAVQNLSGSAEWDTYFAHEDGSKPLDNTQWGSYVFHIPQEANNIILYLGLQNCSGEIYFSNLEIFEITE
ncbi:MAG: hypothetical protein RBR87_08085 [Bacteroidales bacterium]|jgi:hypothetical protein|nr:hypothetical protein [Bacteroidales bacterium]